MLNVVSYKWGNRYAPLYWDRLAKAVKKNLSLPHEFIMICDNADELEGDYTKIRMDMEKDFFGFWTKMTIFRPKPFGITGRILLLDVDTLITGNLDELGNLHDDFYTYPNWWADTIAFAVTLMDAGARTQLWEEFIKDPKGIMERFGNDEEFISKFCPNEKYFPAPWVRSYKAHCVGRGVPEGCKFVCFHGKPDPHEVIDKRDGRTALGPDPWIADYW